MFGEKKPHVGLLIKILILTAVLIPYQGLFVFADSVNITVSVVEPECSDGIDNDGDSLIDFPDDLGCESALDDSEQEEYQCSDGIDNDGDGDIDFPNDAGCDSLSDDDEFNVTPSGGGGGGGGRSDDESDSQSMVDLSGFAIPNSKIVVLQNGDEIVRTISDGFGEFSVRVRNLDAGTYHFAVYSIDPNNHRSLTFSFPITLSSGASTEINGVFLAPTFTSDKIEVRRGDVITFFGYTAPDADVLIRVNSEVEILVNTKADTFGSYLVHFDSQQLEIGDHTAQSRAVSGNNFSPFGIAANFEVGNKNVFREQESQEEEDVIVVLKGDINGDGRVNLFDFSIAAFWYRKSLTGDIVLREKLVLNNDERIDLVDFSIMAFHWTG